MLVIKKATLKKSAFFIVSLAFIVLMVALLAPSGVSFADNGPNCVDDGVASDDEDCSCKDVVCEEDPWNETAASACGTISTTGACPDGLSEFGGVCWDACECEGLCTEVDIEEAKKAGGGTCESDLHSRRSYLTEEACLEGIPTVETICTEDKGGVVCSSACTLSLSGFWGLDVGCDVPDVP